MWVCGGKPPLFTFISPASSPHLTSYTCGRGLRDTKTFASQRSPSWWPPFLLGKLLTHENIPSIRNSLFQKDSSPEWGNNYLEHEWRGEGWVPSPL